MTDVESSRAAAQFVDGQASDARKASETEPRLTVHYNGSCPICRPEVEHYRRSAERHGIEDLSFVDVTAGDDPGLTARLARHGLTRDQAARRFAVVTADGRLLDGVDAFVALWGRLPKFRWLARVIGSPAIRPAARVVYDRILAPLLYWSNKRAGRLPSA